MKKKTADKLQIQKCDCAAGCCGPIERRDFLRFVAMGAAAGLTAQMPVMAGPFEGGGFAARIARGTENGDARQQPVAVLFNEANWESLKRFVPAYNRVWTASPLVATADTVYAPVMGNGNMSVCLSGDNDTQVYYMRTGGFLDGRRPERRSVSRQQRRPGHRRRPRARNPVGLSADRRGEAGFAVVAARPSRRLPTRRGHSGCGDQVFTPVRRVRAPGPFLGGSHGGHDGG